MFCEKGVLENFAKFTGKRLRQSLPRPAALLKKETLAQVFSCEFCGIFKNTFFTENLGWLLLYLAEKQSSDSFSLILLSLDLVRYSV